MGRHHTKDKGDLGVAKAHADLVGKGFYVLFPATEHAPFGQQKRILTAASFRDLPDKDLPPIGETRTSA